MRQCWRITPTDCGGDGMQNPRTSRSDSRASPGWRLQHLAACITSLALRCPETLAGEPPPPAGDGTRGGGGAGGRQQPLWHPTGDADRLAAYRAAAGPLPAWWDRCVSTAPARVCPCGSYRLRWGEDEVTYPPPLPGTSHGPSARCGA